MKNLIGAAAPTLCIFRSIQFLMLVVLLTFCFASCKDQTKANVSPESELIEKLDFRDAESIMDIGGNQVPPGGFCELHSNQKSGSDATIGGGRGSDGGPGLKSTSNYDIGGGKGDTGDITVSKIGGGKDPNGGPGIHGLLSSNISEISEKSTIEEYAISDIGGRGGVEPPGGIDTNSQPSTVGISGCVLRDF